MLHHWGAENATIWFGCRCVGMFLHIHVSRYFCRKSRNIKDAICSDSTLSAYFGCCILASGACASAAVATTTLDLRFSEIPNAGKPPIHLKLNPCLSIVISNGVESL